MKHHPILRLITIALVLLVIPSCTSFATVYYVRPTGSDGADGLTWMTAKRTIQSAINAAVMNDEATDEVRVAAGNYFAYTGYAGSFSLQAGISLLGGYDPDTDTRDPVNNVSYLVGGAQSVIRVTGTYNSSLTTVIDGFTILGGNDYYGGGIYCRGSNPTISNNTIISCYADFGGAIYCQSPSGSPRIENNQIIGNYALRGGAVYCEGGASPYIIYNTIYDNYAAERGGAILCFSGTPYIENNVIANNFVEAGSGGGIYLDTTTGGRVHNNRVTGNRVVNGSGGGIFVTSSTTTASTTTTPVTNNIVTGNSAAGYFDEYKRFIGGEGGGIYCSGGELELFANNVVSANGAAIGGGIYIAGSSTMRLINNTITSNSASEGGGIFSSSSSPLIANNIVAFNASGIRKDTASNLTLRNNCVYGNENYDYSGMTNPTGSAGNISTDPKLASVAYGNYHIQPTSPCVNFGDDTVVPTFGWQDIDAQSRRQAGRVDIGADESDNSTWTVSPVIVRVSSSGNDLNDGSSWTQSKLSIQAAIDEVSARGGEVWIASGSYSEQIRLLPFTYIYGGFNGTETERAQRNWQAYVTTLNGVGGSTVSVNAGYKVNGVDGFTITRGRGTYLNEMTYGGGIYCYYACPIIANNTIINNSATYGGGIYCDYASPEITGNRIADNTADYGAGIYCDNISLPTINLNVITGNEASEQGGGIGIGRSSSPLISQNNIVGNISRKHGGGIFSSLASPRLMSNAITANTAVMEGAGIYLSSSFPTMVSNTITGNQAYGRGGGIFAVSCTSGTIVNNTMSANIAPTDGAGLYVDTGSTLNVVNNIIAFNTSGVYKHATGSVTFRYNCVYGNTNYNYKGITDPTGTQGNISVDPKLAAVDYRNTHIQPDSPCINTGDKTVIQPEWLDMDSQARVQNNLVDIGADESDGTTWNVFPRIVRVATTGNDANDGSSWAFAKRTIQAAIDSVAIEGGEIWVKKGLYRERIRVRPYVLLYGGFNGDETQREQRAWEANTTTIDGSTAGTVVSFAMGASWSTIDGFTIQYGDAEYGGGIYCHYASPTIANNTITANNAAKGGGIYLYYSSPVISNNRIASNIGGSGGGIFCHYSRPLITENFISANRGGSGGGILCDYSAATITNNTIQGNSGDTGGGIFLNNASTAKVFNNFITRNTASDNGGGICCDLGSSAEIINNTLAGNNADLGGSIYASNSSPKIINNIVAHSSSGVHKAGSGTAVFKNNCIFGNTNGNVVGVSNVLGVNGNISVDPQLVSMQNGDLHLRSDSPCIDKGDSTVVQPDWLDIDGKARIYGNAVDIGGDEWVLDLSAPINDSISPTSCGLPVGDATKSTIVTKYTDPDGYVDLADCYLLINTVLSSAKSVCLRYDAEERKLYLRADTSSQWLGGFAPGSANVIENSQCKLYCAGTTVVGSGSTLTITWKVEFKPSMAGKTCGAWMYVADDTGRIDGWDKMTDYRISNAPVNVSFSSSGSVLAVGTDVTVTSVYSDADGYANLAVCYTLMNTAFAGANSVFMFYDSNTNKLYIRKDDNSGWMGGYAPGSNNIIENTQFRLYCSQTTVTGSGNTLTIRWRIRLKNAMANKNCSVWMYVQDDAGIKVGYDVRGSFTVGQPAYTETPVNQSLTPNTGSFTTGVKTAFTSIYTDGDGAANLAYCYLLINTKLTGVNAIYVMYDANTNRLYVRNDENTSWGAGAVLGSAAVLENRNVKLHCADTTAVASGNTLTVKWAIELKPSMSGKTCPVWMCVYDDNLRVDGWDQMGTLDIIGQPPANISLTPASGQLLVNTNYLFTSQYSDPDGAGHLEGCYLLINTKVTGINGVYVWYDAVENKLYVRNDGNTVWTGGYAPGSANVIQNSYFTLDCSKTKVTASGSKMTINWSITLKSTMSNKHCGAWLFVYDKAGLKDGWDQMGNYTIQ